MQLSTVRYSRLFEARCEDGGTFLFRGRPRFRSDGRTCQVPALGLPLICLTAQSLPSLLHWTGNQAHMTSTGLWRHISPTFTGASQVKMPSSRTPSVLVISYTRLEAPLALVSVIVGYQYSQSAQRVDPITPAMPAIGTRKQGNGSQGHGDNGDTNRRSASSGRDLHL